MICVCLLANSRLLGCLLCCMLTGLFSQVPVIHHDNTLDRCTNGKGNLWEYTIEEVEALDAGTHFNVSFAGERIPRLDALLECCRDLPLGLNLEVKHITVNAEHEPTPAEAEMEEELANVVCDTIERCNVTPDELVFSSFSRVCIAVLRRRLPHFRCAFLVEHIPADWAEFVEQHSCVSLNFNHAMASREQILECKERIPLFSYTVNDPDRAVELLSWGVSGVFTDFPHVVESAIFKSLTQGCDAEVQDLPRETFIARERRFSDIVPPVVS